jgi:hypothetical protein
MLEHHQTTVDVAAQEAERHIREQLSTHGSAQLTAKPEHSGYLSNLLVGLTTMAIETDFLQVYPRITEIRHLPDGTAVVSLELAEVALLAPDV